MAIHTELPIHKLAYDLLGLTIDLVKNMPREVKPVPTAISVCSDKPQKVITTARGWRTWYCAAGIR